jgi:hypothetical protein
LGLVFAGAKAENNCRALSFLRAFSLNNVTAYPKILFSKMNVANAAFETGWTG